MRARPSPGGRRRHDQIGAGQEKWKYPAEYRGAREAPRRLTAQKEEPPPTFGRHLLLAHARYKSLRTDAHQSEKHEQSIRQLTNRPYVQVQCDQIRYFAYRAHYQVDKEKINKSIDPSEGKTAVL